MKTFRTNFFIRSAKKLHSNQLKLLKEAIEVIQKDVFIGELKKGDLSGIRVYKFYMFSQLMLLAYSYQEDIDELTLLSVGPHENFYETLKRKIKG